MSEYKKVGSVPFRKILIHRGDYYFAERNGTKEKKGKKDRFFEKSEMFLTIFDYSYLIIVYASNQDLPKTTAHVCQI